MTKSDNVRQHQSLSIYVYSCSSIQCVLALFFWWQTKIVEELKSSLWLLMEYLEIAFKLSSEILMHEHQFRRQILIATKKVFGERCSAEKTNSFLCFAFFVTESNFHYCFQWINVLDFTRLVLVFFGEEWGVFGIVLHIWVCPVR